MRLATLALGLLSLVAPVTGATFELHERVAARPGGTLEVRISQGSLEIETHDEPEVRVDLRASGWRGSAIDFALTGDGENARLEGSGPGWVPSILGGAKIRVRIRVPETYSLDLRTGGGAIQIEDLGGSVSARTSGGSIELEGAVGSVDLRTSGGSIRVEEVEGDVTLRTSGGTVDASDVTGRIEARTSGGAIRLRDVGGPVLARTSGGPILVRFSGAPEGSLETSGGSIEAEFPEDEGVDLDARTSGGRVHIEEPLRLSGRMERSRADGEINGGGAELQIRTSGGNIRIRGG